MDYMDAYWLQMALSEERKQFSVDASKAKDAVMAEDYPRDTLLMVEHNPVYTLGRRSTTDNIRFDPQRFDCQVHRVERGGEVTFHGPGQLVCYPIVSLEASRKDLRWYLSLVEEVVIRSLGVWGIEARRSPTDPGVWVGDEKVAAVGIAASRWVTMHGFALNVRPDLAWFDRIVPCGIDDGRGVTSMEQLLQGEHGCPGIQDVEIEAA